jgi:hypothetical protein
MNTEESAIDKIHLCFLIFVSLIYFLSAYYILLKVYQSVDFFFVFLYSIIIADLFTVDN